MSSSVLHQVESLLDKLTPGEQAILLENLARRMRLTVLRPFAPLEDTAYLARVRVNPDIGTICWPNGADLDPDVLYSAITGEPINLSEPIGVQRQ